MANVKISDLPASTTPLTGTELVPIVQDGVTKQAALQAAQATLDARVKAFQDKVAAIAV